MTNDYSIRQITTYRYLNKNKDKNRIIEQSCCSENLSFEINIALNFHMRLNTNLMSELKL